MSEARGPIVVVVGVVENNEDVVAQVAAPAPTNQCNSMVGSACLGLSNTLRNVLCKVRTRVEGRTDGRMHAERGRA